MDSEGFTPEAPDVLLNQSWVYAPLLPVWASFQRLSRGRQFSSMGFPMPITYRDMLDECSRCPWPDKTQLEKWLTALDDEFLDLAQKQVEQKKHGQAGNR